MPTYEYTCKNCGANLEIFQKFTDKPLKNCAECGGELQKVFHASGVVFKGSGFYATDSRASATKNTSSDDASSNGDSKKADKKKTEKKVESTSTAKSG
jgi:putative FmdB family regulatory protein